MPPERPASPLWWPAASESPSWPKRVLDNSQVKLLHLKDRLYKRTIYMAYRRDEEQPPSMQAFLRFVLQRARAQSDSQRHS